MQREESWRSCQLRIRGLFTSQALPGTPLDPSTFTPFSRVDAVPSFSTETVCSAPGPKSSSRT